MEEIILFENARSENDIYLLHVFFLLLFSYLLLILS